MSLLLLYILKLSISLAVVWLFYHFILRKLTFYNHNRWYLLGYSLLSFFIPLVNIAPALQNNELAGNPVIQWIPVIHRSSGEAARGIQFTVWSAVVLVIIGGMIFMLIRLLVQLLSFRKMMRKATLIASQEVNIYQVDGDVIPFSFGNAVFINPALHTSEELEDIIRHEFVHVKQRHSLDILFSEGVCLLNWYNPFAWLIRSAIRQNLEFIADNKVLEKGANKKQYQYLLLKVIGNSQFSIAPKFNFSSLKKRIAMMNKLQSSKKHLLRFLFLLPVLAFILVSFRKEIGDRLSGRLRTDMPPITTDTIPHPSTLNNKDYQITVKDNKGNCVLVIRDKTGKEVKQMLLTEWNKDASRYESLYGEIPPPPPPGTPAEPQSTIMQDFLERNPAVKEVGWVYNRDNTAAILHLNKKDGTSERYDLREEKQRKAAEDKYGYLPLIAAAPPAPAVLAAPVEMALPVDASAPLVPWQPAIEKALPVDASAPLVHGQPAIEIAAPQPPAPPDVKDLPPNVTSLQVNNNTVTIKLKNGKVETYDKNNSADMKRFESRYGDILPQTPAPPPAKQPKDVQIVPAKEAPFSGAQLPGNIIYVLDGKKVTVPEVNALDPGNIQQINVLKNESAVNRYGTEAAAGVVEILTKEVNIARPVELVRSNTQVTVKSVPAEVIVEGKPIRKAIGVKNVQVATTVTKKIPVSPVIEVEGKPIQAGKQ